VQSCEGRRTGSVKPEKQQTCKSTIGAGFMTDEEGKKINKEHFHENDRESIEERLKKGFSKAFDSLKKVKLLIHL
jgi:hypothetical protein